MNLSNLNAVVVFKDKFKEIDRNCPGIYAVLAYGYDGIRICKFFTNDKGSWWEMYRQIRVKEECYTLKYFYDEMASKTYIFFGFSKGPIRIYNLKINYWEKNIFPMADNKKGYITSINFFFINFKKYVIFTQESSNLIKIGDIDNGEIVQEIAIPNADSNFDLLVWNCLDHTNVMQTKKKSSKIYIIVASMKNLKDVYNNNKGSVGSVNILSLEQEMSFVLRKSLPNDVYPISLIKAKVIFKNNEKNTNKKILEENVFWKYNEKNTNKKIPEEEKEALIVIDLTRNLVVYEI